MERWQEVELVQRAGIYIWEGFKKLRDRFLLLALFVFNGEGM